MTPTERRLLTLSSLVGAALTLFVLVLWTFGALSPLDRWLYDGRLRWFQHFTKPPTPLPVPPNPSPAFAFYQPNFETKVAQKLGFPEYVVYVNYY